MAEFGIREDQLTKEERIRLEALNQAVTLNAATIISDEQVVSIAKRFERYILEGNG